MNNNLFVEQNPFTLFDLWMKAAEQSEPNDPNAMSLATVDADGLPNVRIVLLKGWDERGFVFYTNMESQKGIEVLNSGKAALNFHWKTKRQQIRIRGTLEPASDEESDAYYNSRSRVSRLGAWASEQSRPLDSRETLMARVAELEKKYPSDDIPRPSHWRGTRVMPVYIEFWQDGDYRLHDRRIFRRESLADGWISERWNP